MTFQDMQDIPMQETLELLQATIYPRHFSPSSPNNTPLSIDLNVEDYIQIFSKWAEKTPHHPQDGI